MCDIDCKDNTDGNGQCDKKFCCDPPTTTTTTTTTSTTTTTTTTTTLETCCEFDCQAPCAIGGPWYDKDHKCKIDCKDNTDGDFVCDKKFCCDPPTTTTTTTTTSTTTTTTTTTTLQSCKGFDCSAPCAIGGPWDDKSHKDLIYCKDNEPSFACDKKFCCDEPTTTTFTTTTLKSCEGYECPEGRAAKAPANLFFCAGNDCTDETCCQEPTTANPCATIAQQQPAAPVAPAAPPSPCTTVLPAQRLYSEEKVQKVANVPAANAQTWALPTLGFFAMCVMLGGYAVTLYRRRRQRVTRDIYQNLMMPEVEAQEDITDIE
jgi:hypothetical protein